MYEDNGGEEYEDIDMDSSGVPFISGIPGQGVGPIKPGAISPSRRPPMPLPGSAPSLQSESEYSYCYNVIIYIYLLQSDTCLLYFLI